MITSARILLQLQALFLLFPSLTGAAASLCGEAATPISHIQGEFSQSPMAGQTVTVEGILTLDTRQKGGFQGFYLQQADDQTDDNPLTSEALFIYTKRKTGKPGNRLRVTGKVKEFHGLTELTGVKAITICGQSTLPRAISLSLPWPQNPESYENMRVRIVQPLTVIDNYNLARYGELTLAAGDQLAATEYRAPSSGIEAVSKKNQHQRVVLDDGRAMRNPDPIPWPPGGFSPEHTVRAGDTVGNLIGVLDFRFGYWRIQPETAPVFNPDNSRLPPPSRPADTHVRVVSINLENYFNGDGNNSKAGFPTARGAKTLAEFKEQHRRLTYALTASDPDILVLSELENDGYGANSAISYLTQALGQNWQFVATPGNDGTDAIRTALLYRHDRIKTLGNPQRLTSGPFQFRGRPPLAQIFQRNDGTSAFRIVSLHLKSKACRGATDADLDQSNGEGCFAKRRTDMAITVTNWLTELPTPDNFSGTLVAGDFNSYSRETPLSVFRNAGFTNMVPHFHPCQKNSCPQYSYRYKGEKGSLDHALASGSLKPFILNAQTWLINADEPQVLAYQSKLNAPEPFPWRSSDHNPVIIDIRL